jgi:hypothetical protein
MKSFFLLYLICYATDPYNCTVMSKGYDTRDELVSIVKKGPDALIDGPFPVYMIDVKNGKITRLMRKDPKEAVTYFHTGEY